MYTVATLPYELLLIITSLTRYDDLPRPARVSTLFLEPARKRLYQTADLTRTGYRYQITAQLEALRNPGIARHVEDLRLGYCLDGYYIELKLNND